MNSVVIGGGAWGSAIANLLASNTCKVRILSRNPVVIESINKSHINTVYLPDFRLNHNISATSEASVLDDAELAFIAVPSQNMRETLRKVKQNIGADVQIILCSKGIEKESLLLMSEVAYEELPDNELFVLSGPNFAHEILAEKHSFSNLAGRNKDTYRKIAKALSTRTFSTRHILDINGTQVFSSFKNVMAIMYGLLTRLEVGFNTLSALVTFSLEEVRSFVEIKGGDPRTIIEFCGVGDLVLTCFSDKSRNFRYGYGLANNHKDDALVEGRSTLESLYALARRHNIDCILVNTLHAIVTSRSRGTDSFMEEVQRILDLAFRKLAKHTGNY